MPQDDIQTERSRHVFIPRWKQWGFLAELTAHRVACLVGMLGQTVAVVSGLPWGLRRVVAG